MDALDRPEWVVPEVAPVPTPLDAPDVARATGQRAGGARGAGAARLAVTGVDRPAPFPYALQQRANSELFDHGLALVKAQRRLLAVLLAPIVVPVSLLGAYLERADANANALTQFGSTTIRLNRGGAAWSLLLSSLLLALVALVVALVIDEWLRNDAPPTAAIVVRRALPRVPSLFVAWAAVHVCILLGLLACGLGALAVSAVFVVTVPVVAIEGVGPFEAMGRARQLGESSFGRRLGFVLVSALAWTIIRTALELVPSVVAALVGTSWGWIVTGAARIVVTGLVDASLAAATVLLYFDLRVRREGLDIDRRADEVFGRG